MRVVDCGEPPVPAHPAQTPRLAVLTDADRSAWEPLARGYKAFYETELSDAGYDLAWARLRAGAPLLALGAWVDGPDGAKLVGIAHAVFHASVWDDKVCYLQDLFVDPAARGQGVAAALIEHLAGQARPNGVARLYWLTHQDNARARALYDRVARTRGHIRYDHAMGA